MPEPQEVGRFKGYVVALGVTTLAVFARWLLDGLLKQDLPYATYYMAVALAAWYGGFWPGALSIILCVTAAASMTLSPRGTLEIHRLSDAIGLVLFIGTGLLILLITDQNRRALQRAENSAREVIHQREWFHVTLRSIGDGVIATDNESRVTFLNEVAEKLTGWPSNEAIGKPLVEIFAIVNEQTRLPVDDLVKKVLREGKVVGMANHTLLIGREGSEHPIDDSAAPILNDDGTIGGVVLVFRDVTEDRQAQHDILQREKSYRTLAEGLALFVWSSGPDGKTEYLNRHWQEYTGLSAEETHQGRWAEVIHPDDLATVRNGWINALEKGEVFEFEYRVRRISDQTYRWHLGRVHPVRDDEGPILRWFGTGIDIEDRKRGLEALRAGEERLRLALEAGRMGTWEFDIASGSVAWSPSLEVLHGLVPGTFPGTFEAYQSVIHPEDREQVLNSIRNVVENGAEHHVEYRLVWPDHSIHWIEARGKPIFNASGKVTRLLGICMDTTDRKRQEEELHKALALAEQAAQARDQFLAMLSHELRTPLSPVLLAVDDLVTTPNLDEGHRELLTSIRQNVELEVRLIDDLLEVMRIVRGKLPFHFETADVHELIRRTVEICRGDADAKSLSINVQTEATRHVVRADPARLQQVLWNLLKNAVKFTPEHGSIQIRTWIEASGDRIGVEVKDTGIGIEPSALSRIFNAFEQAEDSVTVRFGGLGLGLAISKSIVEAHGGILSAWSDGKGKGTNLWFTLELSATTPELRLDGPSAVPSPSESASSQSLLGLRLLLVEDDPMTSRLMARLLRQNGYEVVTANTMAAALAVPADAFDLVISDLGLPDGSGLDLMHRLSPNGDIPGIALTGYGREEDINKCHKAGFMAHLTKPVDFTRLETMIRRVASDPHQQLTAEFPIQNGSEFG